MSDGFAVALAEKAVGDLIRIGSFIARDNPTRAESFVAELEASCRGLGSWPRAYPLLPGYEARGVRRRAHGDYLIVFTVDEAAALVVVIRVLHGARDIEAVLAAP